MLNMFGQMKQTTGTASQRKPRRYREKKKSANHSSAQARIKTTTETDLTVIFKETSPMKKKKNK